MHEQQGEEIAETAFKARFGEVNVVCVNVKPGFDHWTTRCSEVKIIYDGEFEQQRWVGSVRVAVMENALVQPTSRRASRPQRWYR